MRIILVRHGQPNISWPSSVKAKDIGEWINDYDATGLVSTSIPPDDLRVKVTSCNAIISSDLSRAIESVEKFNFPGLIVSNKCCREVMLPHFNIPFIKLPAKLWALVFRILWYVGLSNNGESKAVLNKRITVTVDKLLQLTNEHKSVCLLGHGYMNRLIAKELTRRGWQGDTYSGSNYWDCGEYSKI